MQNNSENRAYYRHEQKRKKAKNQKLAICIACGLLALVLIAVFISVILTSCGKPMDASGVISQIIDDEYDPNATVIDTEKYKDTILGESENAGADYIDETLFIGDSNTYRMMAYGKTSLKNDIGIVGMGVQQVVDTKCVYFEGYDEAVTIPEAVKILQPKRIIITFGTNNTVGWSPESFKKDYKKALDAIHKAYPYAAIILNSISPVNQLHDNPDLTMETIDKLNVVLVELAEEEGYKFLNSAEVLKDKNTGYAKDQFTIGDGIHLTKKAFTAMFDYFCTHSYIIEDTRPKPLKKIPNRTETSPFVISEDPYIVYGQSSSASYSSSGQTQLITFKVNDTKMGTIMGEVTQNVVLGEKCTKVTATPAQGYKFAYWGCSVGSISEVFSKELIFIPPSWTGEDVVVTAYFEIDNSQSSSAISSIPQSSSVSSTPQSSSSNTSSSDTSSAPQSSSLPATPSSSDSQSSSSSAE